MGLIEPKPINDLEQFVNLTRCLNPEKWKKRKTNLILLRHGKTPWNEQGLLQGTDDLDILPNEENRITAEANNLRQVISPNSLIISSALRRAKKTADIYATVLHLPTQENPNFNELNFGQWQGMRIEDLKMDPQHQFFLSKPISASKQGIPPEGENFLDFLIRVYQGIDLIADLNQQIILVTHAGVIRAVRFIDLIINGRPVKEEEFFFAGENFIKIPHIPIQLGEQGEFVSVVEEV